MRNLGSLVDRLGWAEVVAPGVVLMRHRGALLAAWRYSGPDMVTLGEAERHVLTLRVGDALSVIGEGWMQHWDRIRRESRGYAPEGAFPDAATRRIDELRRESYSEAGRHYETEHVLSVTYAPPSEQRSRLARWFVSESQEHASEFGQTLADFEAKLREMEDRLGGVLHLERLSSDEMLSHLYECLTGRRQWVRTPPPGTDVSDLLACEMLGGWEPRAGSLGWEERSVLAIHISGFPLEVEAGVLDALDRLPFGLRFSTRWIPVDNGLKTNLKFAVRKQLWNLAALPWFFQRKHAAAMAAEVEEAANEFASGEARYGHYTAVVLVRTRAEAVEVLRVVRERGFVADVENVNALEAVLGTLPGHGGWNVRRAFVSTRNLTDLLPLSSIWVGEETCPSPKLNGAPALLWARTEGTTPFRLNLHVGDVGHALVVGPTGMGKTTLLNLLAAQWRRYAGARTVTFDVKRGAEPLALRSGARHYALAAERPDSVRLQPLADVDRPSERTWAGDWLGTLFTLQGLTLTPAQRESIDRAVTLLGSQPREHRTLTGLLVQLQDAELQTALRAYTVDGPLGHLLDASRSDVGESDHEVFEMQAVMGMGERVLVPVLLHLFHHVTRHLNPAVPTLVQVDEAWMALTHEVFAAQIAAQLRLARDKNAAFVLATQSPSDLADSALRPILLESCPTRIYLPNPDALTAEGARVYARLGLSPHETQLVGRALPKREYYYRSPKGARLFELGIGKEEMEMFTQLPQGGTHAAQISLVS